MYSNPEHAFGGMSSMSALIERIYGSAQDATLWPVTLAAISEAVHGESIALYAGFPNFKTPDLHAIANCPSGAWEAFGAYYATINPIMESCLALLTPDTPWQSDQGISNASFEKTEFYNDFFSPYGMYFSLGCNLDFDDAPSASLSCQRPKHLGTFSSQDCLVIETLMPHLKRALQIHSKMSSLEAAALGLEAALDLHDHALVGVNWQGKVCLNNSMALDLFAAGDGLYLAEERLHCVLPKEDSALQQMIASQILDLSKDASIDALRVSRSNRAPLHLSILPFRKALSGRLSPLAGLVFITDPQFASSRATIAKRLFGVTPSEARVADLMLQGLDIREISEKLKTTLETTRFQVKQLLAKTGTRRQAELLRLLAALPGSKIHSAYALPLLSLVAACRNYGTPNPAQTLNLSTDVHEFTAAYSIHPKHIPFQPFVDIGGGFLDFTPRNASNQFRETGLAEVGFD
jgi:DNA-binding CsgD family transcriptional regulator